MQRIGKFPKKILVWLAISEFGISAPVVRYKNSKSIDQHVDLFKEEIASFYKKKHRKNNGNYILDQI